MLFDAGCVVCGARPGPVCAECAGRLTLGGALEVDGLDACAAAYVLDDRARPIVAALKYRRQRRLAKWFAARTSSLVPRAADAVTWLPATPERRRSRGFDQAEELARALARTTGLPVKRLLLRNSSDQRQTGQSRRGRLAGPQLRSTTPSPPFVVIVDDVVTTGSSLRVAAVALRNAGAQRVVGIAMAATPASGRLSRLELTPGGSVHKWM